MRQTFLLLTALLCSMTPGAGAPATKLTVEVQSASSGKPIDRASVIVKFVKGRAKIKLGWKDRTTWETKTDQGGLAKIPSIPQGTIQVQVIASNFQTFGGVFDVNEDEKTITIKLNPPQAQYSAH
jgi:hypothetical protein